jgi:hypothetical protein
MSLKQDYFDGVTGFTEKMAASFAAGSAFVSANSTALTAALQEAAAAGKKTFTVSIVTSDNPAYLRLNGLYAKTYLAGVVQALGAEDIYSYECSPTLNLADAVSVKVDFNFTF